MTTDDINKLNAAFSHHLHRQIFRSIEHADKTGTRSEFCDDITALIGKNLPQSVIDIIPCSIAIEYHTMLDRQFNQVLVLQMVYASEVTLCDPAYEIELNTFVRSAYSVCKCEHYLFTGSNGTWAIDRTESGGWIMNLVEVRA